MVSSGWCVWVTGLPGSGKSVVCEALTKLLEQRNVNAELLGSDNLRKLLTPRPTFSLEERDIVYSALAYIAKLLVRNNVNVVIDATGNLRRYRDSARNDIERFVEVFLDCPLDVCVKRESERNRLFGAPRHIYERAKDGKALNVPGIGQPYEAPPNPELVIESARHSPHEAATKIVEKLQSLDYLV